MSDLEKNAPQSESKKKLKIAVIIVLAIFIISCVALVARIIYVHSVAQPGDTIVYVPQKLIDAEKEVDSDGVPLLRASSNLLRVGTPLLSQIPVYWGPSSDIPAEVIELHSGQSADNDRFDVQNMLPGDTYTKYYCLKVYHRGDITAYFNIKNVNATKALDTILNIKVTRLDEESPVVLCNGTFAAMKDNDMPINISATSENETVMFFRIDVSLPTSAGNEFQAANLTADFNWFAANPERVTTVRPRPQETTPTPPDTTPTPPDTTPTPPDTTPTPPDTTPIPPDTTPTPPDTTPTPPDTTTTGEDPGQLIPKPNIYLIWPWMIVPIISLAVLIILLVNYNKKEEDDTNE